MKTGVTLLESRPFRLNVNRLCAATAPSEDYEPTDDERH